MPFAVLHESLVLSGSAKLRVGGVLSSRERQGTPPLLRNHLRLWGQPWPQRLSDERHELRQLSSALFIVLSLVCLVQPNLILEYGWRIVAV